MASSMGSGGIDGMQELIDKLDKLGAVKNKVAGRALKAGADIVNARQQNIAPFKTGGGLGQISTSRVKTSGTKSKYIQVGLIYGFDWEKGRGVYFQHYGFHNKRQNRYYPPKLWMDKAFEQTQEEAGQAMLNIIKKELEL